MGERGALKTREGEREIAQRNKKETAKKHREEIVAKEERLCTYRKQTARTAKHAEIRRECEQRVTKIRWKTGTKEKKDSSEPSRMMQREHEEEEQRMWTDTEESMETKNPGAEK